MGDARLSAEHDSGILTMKPQRLQLSRKRGFNLQAVSHALNGLPAVNCARPSKWGNPFRIGGWFMVGDPNPNALLKMIWCEAANAEIAGRPPGQFTLVDSNDKAVKMFRKLCETSKWAQTRNISELRGKNLACWCAADSPCHCDVLLEIANA